MPQAPNFSTLLTETTPVRVVSLLIVGAIFGVPSVFYGDALGLSRPAVIVVAIVGSMIGVTINLLASDWIADRLRRRADTKGTTSRVDRASVRAGPILDRLGAVGLGLIGPILLGTFGTALVGPLIGISRRKVFLALLRGVTHSFGGRSRPGNVLSTPLARPPRSFVLSRGRQSRTC